jgi:hypothetical protein
MLQFERRKVYTQLSFSVCISSKSYFRCVVPLHEDNREGTYPEAYVGEDQALEQLCNGFAAGAPLSQTALSVPTNMLLF